MNKIRSVLRNRCPRCHQGAFWKNDNPYNLSEFYKMNSSCANCKLHYEKEPGFWFGAMFVSYAIGVAALVGSWIFCLIVFPNSSVFLTIALVCATLLVIAPINFRLSRLLWINFFVNYDPKLKDEF